MAKHAKRPITGPARGVPMGTAPRARRPGPPAAAPEVPAPEGAPVPALAVDDAGVATVTRVTDLITDQKNANAGTPHGRAMLETSLRRYGAGRSVLVDRKGRIIAGNKTVETAVDVGLEETIVVQTDGKKLVVVQRTDLDLTDGTAAAELGIADNRIAEVDLQWNPEILTELLSRGVQLEEFFNPSDLDKILEAEVESHAEAPSTVPDMELLPFEEYDYVMIVFRNSQDWQRALELLELRKEVWTDGTVRKVGLSRVIEGGRFLAAVAPERVAQARLPRAATAAEGEAVGLPANGRDG